MMETINIEIPDTVEEVIKIWEAAEVEGERCHLVVFMGTEKGMREMIRVPFQLQGGWPKPGESRSQMVEFDINVEVRDDKYAIYCPGNDPVILYPDGGPSRMYPGDKMCLTVWIDNR